MGHIEWQTILAAVSALTAMISVILALRATRVQSHLQKYSANYGHIALAEALIKDNVQLLELHGVTHELMEQNDVKAVEVLYLLHSFTAGDLFYQLGGPVPITAYRKALLESPKVRNVWANVLKHRFIPDDGTFAKAVDNHIQRTYPRR